MSDLTDLVPSLQRAAAVPGTFETLFPETFEEDLLALLADAFAEAQLDGWMTGKTLDLVTSLITPDLSTAETALVVLYANIRLLTAEIRNRKTHVRYEGAGNVFEQDQSAAMLVELLREMNQRKNLLQQQAARGSIDSAFYMDDAYLARLVE